MNLEKEKEKLMSELKILQEQIEKAEQMKISFIQEGIKKKGVLEFLESLVLDENGQILGKEVKIQTNGTQPSQEEVKQNATSDSKL